MQSTKETKCLAEILEEEWVEQSEELEEKHFDAAFEAKVAEIEIDATITNVDNNNHGNHNVVPVQIYRKKSNCYSPYVPSNALRIQGMIDFVQFIPSDVFCDMGCGDGRVCCCVVAAAQQQQNIQPQEKKETKFRAIGIDVSNDCIDMAQKHLMTNQHLTQDVKNCIQFYQADLTIHPNELLSVTLTYHIHQLRQLTSKCSDEPVWAYNLERVNEEHDLCLYTNLSLLSTGDISATAKR